MVARAHVTEVANWLMDLATLTAGNAPIEELKQKIGGMTALISEDFPDSRCFTRPSLVAIAKQNTFFPTYGVLHKQIEAWWQANKPKRLDGPGADDDTLSAADRCMVGFWNEYRAGTKKFEAGSGVTLASWLSMCRAHCPKAYRYLVERDLYAAAVAVKRGWDRDSPLTDEERNQVITTSEQMRGKLQQKPPSDMLH